MNDQIKEKKVCLIIGAGAGIGGAITKKFASEGYHVCFARRSDQNALINMEKDLKSCGYSASGYILDVTKKDTIEELVENIEQKIGSIHTAVYNVGAQIGNRSLQDTKLKTFELGWKLGTFGLYRLAKNLLPIMAARGTGNLLVTGATASVRGNSGQHSHAATMASRRMLCQSLNAEFGKQGVHICHIIIDGLVDAPDTLGKMLGPEQFELLRQKKGYEKNGLLLPSHIAETYYHLAHQHPSTWTFETDLRPHSAIPWWNHVTKDF
ncbi:MAG: SDR family NAD(P)-dependent oxidoreductase [Betaproteobacteria bacterium]